MMPLRNLFLVLVLAVLPVPLFGQGVERESFRGRDVVAGEIIVRFRGDTLPSAAVQGIENASVKALLPSRAMLLRSPGRSVEELLQVYTGRPDVLYAEPNYLWRKEDLPNDVFFDAQWGLRNTGQSILGRSGTPGADIGAAEAWDIAQGSRSFVIGIVDSGIDYNHPDLAANMWSAPIEFTVVVGGQSITCAAGTHGFNAITRTCEPMDDDTESHGTHVAGIIGSAGDNGLGVTGVNRVASIMALKFIDFTGTGSTADAIAAIEFAIQAKAVLGASANVRILNNSWGSSNFSQALADAVLAASNADMLFVASAGNLAMNTDSTPHYPSGFNAPNLISVTSTNNRDTLDDFSNFGVTSVHLAAPGNNVASTLAGITYGFVQGTSMSAAMVSGAAGLVLSGCSLTTSGLKANLLGSVDPIPGLESKMSSGGRLNVHQSLVSCAGAPPGFTLKSVSPFLLPGVAGSANATINMNPLNGFAADVTLEVVAPPNFTVSLASPSLSVGLPSTSMTVTAGLSVAPGTYPVYVTGTSGGIARTAGVTFIVGTPISSGQNLERTWSVSTSEPDRFGPGNRLPPGLVDWYQLVLNSTTAVNISLYFQNSQGNGLRLLNSSGAVVAVGSDPLGNVLHLTHNPTPGVYFIAVTTGLAGGSSYAVSVNAPLLRSVSPNSAEQGSSFEASLSGTQFAPGVTVDAGNDITVSNVVFRHSQSVTATFAISAGAVLGERSVRVSTPAGSSNSAVLTVVRPRPVITSITPGSAVVGTSVDIAILGAHFVDPTVGVTGSDLTLENITVVNTTLITGRITVSPNAEVGGKQIRVTTIAGFTTAVFQVFPLPPTLTSISPSSGTLGSVIEVTLNGTQLYGPVTFDTGGGITVTSVNLFSNRTVASARFNIAATAALGIRNITLTTPGGTSNSVVFTVTPAPPPVLTSISPDSGPQTTSRTLDVRGNNLTTGFAFHPGSDIVVSQVEIVNLTRATVTIQIAGTAALGPRNVWISTAGGTSNPVVFTVLPPPPTLTSISPSSGTQQSAMNVTFTGTNFVEGMTVQPGPLNVSQLSVIDSTTATAVLTVPQSTQTGNHNVRISTVSGTSASVIFTVLPGIPTLTGINPTFGVRGRTNRVTLTGTNFATESTTVSPIPGVSMSSISIGGGSAVFEFHIDNSAPLGPHEVTVTTPAGTTQPVTYSIFDPFPDLVIGSGPIELWAGLNNTFTLGISNSGTAAATTMTVTDLLPPEVTFISGGANGFSCSANGQLVTCTYSGIPFQPLSSSFISITVAVSAGATSSMSHTVSAVHAQDMNPSNNTATSTFTLGTLPNLRLTLTPLSLPAGQQGSVTLSLLAIVPHDVTGTLLLSFSSTASNPADDPAVQFASGGRQVSFVIPAGAIQARFSSGPFGNSIGYQTGTVAGTITISGTAQVGSIQKSFASDSGSVTIASAPPVVHTIRTETQGGFAALITSSSSPRAITELNLRFLTTPPAQLSCGSIPGCTVSGLTMTLDVRALFDNWFTANTAFGSLSTLRVPISVQGIVFGSVSITLKNALGTSNAMTVPLQ